MSGMSRALSLGTLGPVCQYGFENRVLAPPTLDQKPGVIASFQTFSGMYDNADPPLALLVVAQYLPLPSLNSVPPTAVTSGKLAGAPMLRPLVACCVGECRSHSTP